MQIIQKKSSKTLSILKSFQGSGTLFYKLFVFYIVNSNISCFCFYAVIMACKHTALYTNPTSCFCLCFNRLCIIYSVKTVLKYKFFQRCIFYRKSKFIMMCSVSVCCPLPLRLRSASIYYYHYSTHMPLHRMQTDRW